MQEVGRRIERIDVPSVTLIGSLDASALLHDEAIARTRLGEIVIEGLLRALVGKTDKVARPLHRHLQFADLAEIAFESATGLDGGAGHHGHQSGADHEIFPSAAKGGARFMEGLASRQMRAARPARTGSVDVRNEPPGAGPIGVVFGAEGLAEQALLSLDASEHDSEHMTAIATPTPERNASPQPSTATKRPR